jgi:hypothetical protein
MDNDDYKEEKIRNLGIEFLKLKLEFVKVFLTFCSIIVAIEVFIISNSSFDSNIKIGGLVAVLGLNLIMGFYFIGQINEARVYYLGF